MEPSSEIVAHPDLVVSEIGAGTAERVISALHARLSATTPAVTDAPGFLTALLQRARLASVAISPEVAIPHARSDAVQRTVLAVARSSVGIAFDPAHPRVRLIFLIGTPRPRVGEYLQVVAAISRLLKRAGMLESLLAAANEDELRALFSRTINVAV